MVPDGSVSVEETRVREPENPEEEELFRGDEVERTFHRSGGDEHEGVAWRGTGGRGCPVG